MSSKQNLEVALSISGMQAVQAGIERTALGIQSIGEAASRTMEALAAWAGAEGFKNVINAATETNVVMAQLRRALLQHGDATGESIKRLAEQAESLEHLTGVSQDTTLSIDRMLVSSGATADQAMQLTPLIMDLSAAMGMDATSAAMRLSGAFQGQAVEFGRLHIQAGNVNDLIGQLSGRFQGEAEAAFKARGALGQLSVATEESKRALGGLISEPSNRFFAAIAEGLERSTSRLNAFKDEYPRAYDAMNKASEMTGRVLGDNLGKILLFGGALAGMIVVIKSATSVIEILKTALTALGMSATAASASISLVGAAMAGWAIGTWVSQIQFLGFAVSDYLVLPMLQAEKVLIRVQHMLGGMTAEKFKHDMADVQGSIDGIMNPTKRAQPKAAGDSSGVASVPGSQPYTMQDLEKARQKIDLDREANRLLIEQTELTGSQQDKEAILPGLYQKELDFLVQKQALVHNAEDVKHILSVIDATKMLQEDDKAAIAVQKEAYALAMQGTERFFADMNRQETAVKDAITLKRDLYQSSPIYTELEKRTELLRSYADEKKAIQADIDKLKEKLALATTEPQKKAISDEIGTKQHDLTGVNEQSAKAGQNDPTSFKDQWTKVLTDLRGQFVSFAEETSKTFESLFNSAFESINANISKVIMGTEAWKVALYQIGESILSSVITAIMQMAEKWIVSMMLMAVEGIATATAAAAIQSAVWTGPATLSTIATAGGAAYAAPGEVMGAMAATAGAAFADGGYTGAGGKYDAAGIVHRGEFVFDQDSVNRIGLPNLHAMHSGSMPESRSNGGNTQIHVWNDHSAMLAHIKNNSDVQHAITQVVAGNRHQIVPRSA